MSVPLKWRPPLALIVTGFVGLVLVLPTLAMALVVAVSRSPDVLVASLEANWGKIALALIAVLIATGITAFVFWRFLSRPLGKLADEADKVARAPAPFATEGPYGTHEVARLADSFAVLVARLQKRSAYLETMSAHFAHELKSPLTSIKGAAELLRDEWETMEPAQRERFLSNIVADVDHLSTFGSRLRDLARADMGSGSGTVSLTDLTTDVAEAFPGLAISSKGPAGQMLPLTRETGALALHHLADNAVKHGATNLSLKLLADGVLEIANDGAPIGPAVADTLFEPFVTTRRQDGGTGLGLAIVAALLRSAGGTVALLKSDPPTFQISFCDRER
ncbi:MAG: two-component sensor histidine kinase [Hyphomicrobiales bacterium]|nr:MAG: two-component sensor histidine kinase [Hyphomicrobiales bacterium]